MIGIPLTNLNSKFNDISNEYFVSGLSGNIFEVTSGFINTLSGFNSKLKLIQETLSGSILDLSFNIFDK